MLTHNRLNKSRLNFMVYKLRNVTLFVQTGKNQGFISQNFMPKNHSLHQSNVQNITGTSLPGKHLL